MAYIMVVDDDEDFAEAIAVVLRGAGHEVDVSLDPRGAVGMMESRRPDIVILDVMFPGDSCAGFQLARTIRHHSDTLRGIPVLMVTAVNSSFPYSFSGRDIDDNWLPVAGFIEKPVDFGELRSRIEAILEA